MDAFQWCLKYWHPNHSQGMAMLRQLTREQMNEVHMRYLDRFRYRK